MPSAEKESLIRVNCAGVPFSARSPPSKQNSAVGALAFIWRTTSSNHGRQASSRACRSLTAMNVKSSWAGASAPRRRPGQTPSDNNAPADRRSHSRRLRAADMRNAIQRRDKRHWEVGIKKDEVGTQRLAVESVKLRWSHAPLRS